MFEWHVVFPILGDYFVTAISPNAMPCNFKLISYKITQNEDISLKDFIGKARRLSRGYKPKYCFPRGSSRFVVGCEMLIGKLCFINYFYCIRRIKLRV